MDLDLLWLSLWPQFTSNISKRAYQFLFLGIDRNNRITDAKLLGCLLVDVFELRIPIGMARTLKSFSICLKAVILFLQNPSNRSIATLMSHPHQFISKYTNTLACPAQWRFRIATRVGFDQSLEIARQSLVGGDKTLSPTTWLADTF